MSDATSCTSDTCPCRTVPALGPSIGSLVNDQQHTDYIVFPLVAGTLAHCVLATRPSIPRMPVDALLETGLVDHARLILRLADSATGADSWERDRDAFNAIVQFVVVAWDFFPRWVPDHYVQLACDWDGVSPSSLIRSAREWVKPGNERTLTELVLFTADVANRVAGQKRELPLESKAVRPLRVEIAARLRARGLTTWPRVLQAAVADWTTATLERLLADFAADPLSISNAMLTSLGIDVDAIGRELADPDDDLFDEPLAAPLSDVPAEPAPNVPPPDAKLEAMLTEAMAEIDRGEARRQVIEAERLKLAERNAGLQGHIERLTSDLASSEARVRELEATAASLRRERDELVDRFVAEESLTGARAAAPADAFAGCRVCVFVGGPTGAVRDELVARFGAFGAADLNVYDIDRDRGPDAYPAHAVVILGVATMGHSASEYVLSRARASRVWYFRGGYGASRLAAAAAAAYAARRAISGDGK